MAQQLPDYAISQFIAAWREELDDRLGLSYSTFTLGDLVVEEPSSPVDSRASIFGSQFELSDGTFRQKRNRSPPRARLEQIYGWKLWITIACLCLGLLLSSLETTIIATSLISISTSLGNFEKSNWIVTSYLLTYTGFLIIFSQISDLFGRKSTYLVSLILFTIFSLACGLSTSMEQIIIFRSFQGIGGAGLYSMAMSVITEITPLRFVGVSSGLMGSVFALSSILGPILGGAITSHTTWRWVFYLNVPAGGLAMIAVIIFFPRNAVPLPIRRRTFASIDYPGIIFYLTGCILVIFALEEGGTSFPWDSGPSIAAFTLSSIGFLAFIGWEWLISRISVFNMPLIGLFPVKLAQQRIIGFSFLTGFLAGFPFLVTIVFLPQRFQLQNALSPVDSGIRILPLLLLSATSAGIGGAISTFRNMTWYLLAGSLALQIVGLGMMTTLITTASDVNPAQYGYQAILGLGFGFSLSCLVVVAQADVKSTKDVGIAIATITQLRVLGGVIGVAAAQAIMNDRLISTLSPVLTPEKLQALLRSPQVVSTFTAEEAYLTINCYGNGFNFLNKIMMAFSSAALLASIGCWQRNPETLDEIVKRRIKLEGKEFTD